jgi:hypothetical protein
MRISHAEAGREAKRAVSLMVRFLQSRREKDWAAVFAEMDDALAAGDEVQALRLFRSIPLENMGGFFDLCICRENGHKTSDDQLDTDLLPVLYSNVKEWFDALRRPRRTIPGRRSRR